MFMCFNSHKWHSCRDSSFLTVFFLFSCAATNQGNLMFKTTIIEDTHLTLEAILFKVEVNNSLVSLLLQTCEKNFAEFPFLYSVYSLITLKKYKFYRNGNSANLFLYICNNKKFKELFTPTWNGIAVSVQYVSSMQVVLNTRLGD